MIPHPTEVRYIEEAQQLIIEFSDGLKVEYPTPFLRGFCPCAKCQGHGGGPATWTAAPHPRAYVVENASPVGTYALCIVWGDGHDTGIYTFEALREMDARDFDLSAMTPETAIPKRVG